MLRLLIVSHHYEPRDSIATQRVVAMARHLAEIGWDIRVVTPEAGREGLPAVCRVADPVLHLARWSADQRGMRRTFGRAMGRLLRLSLFPDESLPWATRASRVSLGGWEPDVVWASGPPFSCFLAARRLAKRFGVPWVADYRDLWSASPYFPGGAIRRRFHQAIERCVLRSVAFTTAVSRPLVESLEAQIGKPGLEVRNGYEPEEFRHLEGPASDTLGPLRLVYCGEIYPGKRDPQPLFDALVGLGLGPEDVIVEFYGSTVHLLEPAVEKLGLGDVVTFYPRVGRQQSLALQRSADVLLLLLWNDDRESGTYSGKLFEYLGAARPILLIGFTEGVAAKLISACEAGVVAESASDVARHVRAWREEKLRGGIPDLRVRPNCQLTRRDQAARMDVALSRIVE